MAEWTDRPPRPKGPGQDLAIKKNGQCSDCLVSIGLMMRFSPRPEIWTKSFGCEWQVLIFRSIQQRKKNWGKIPWMIVFAQNMNPKLSPMVILKPKRQLSCSRPVNYTSAISDVHNRVYDTNRITHTLTITDFHPLILACLMDISWMSPVMKMNLRIIG